VWVLRCSVWDMRKTGLLLIAAGMLALTGCAPQGISEVAAEHCADLAETRGAYNDSHDGDGAVSEIHSTEMEEPTEDPAGGAWTVGGTASVTLLGGDDATVTLRCFVQRPDDTVLADIVQWRVTG